MDAKELINVIKLSQGKIKLIETKEDGHQVMTSKNDIIGYISDKELHAAIDMIMDEISTGIVDIIFEIFMMVIKLHEKENHEKEKHKEVKFDA